MGDEKILLLVKEDQFRELSAGAFKGFKPRLFHAESLESAQDIARRERPQLILLADNLPGLDTVAGCAAFSRDDDLCAIPVVVLAYAHAGNAEQLGKAGCADYLVMPMERTQLFPRLCQYVPCLKLQEERIPYYSQVTIQDNNDKYYGMSGDISGGGLFVATFDTLPAEGEVQLSFTLPGDTTIPVETRGRVVWTNNKQNPVSPLPEGFGVEFTSITSEEYQAIKEFIARTRREKGAVS